MKILMTLLLLPSLVLTGCAKLNEDFDCPAPKGGSCKRMDQVYDMVNGKGKSLAVTSNRNPLVIEGRPGQPLRYGEGVMPLWVAPYEDTDGNYHQANRVYSVVKEGQWMQQTQLTSK
ncbi:MAG: type IV conjugative transfer system lipoprotein TraV [Legionella sp.]